MQKKRNKLYLKPNFNLKSLDKDLPIGLKDFQNIVDRISVRYPGLKKSEITFIIRKFMEEIREQLLAGYILNINDFMCNTQIYTFCQLKNDKVQFNLKVQTTTPKKFK